MSVKTVSSQADAANPLGYEKEGKLLVGFAIPCIISMLVTSLYNIVDQIFIGQGVGLLGNAAPALRFLSRLPAQPLRCCSVSAVRRISVSSWVQAMKSVLLNMQATACV